MSETNTKESAGKGDTKQPADEKKSKGKLIAIIIAVLALIIIIALVVVIVILLGKGNEKPAAAAEARSVARGTLVTPENVDEIRASLNQPVEDGYYESKMNIDWVFDTAKTPSENAYVENPTSNTRSVYFDLTLSDTGELLYSSPYIPVGGILTGFALDADLEAGTHSGVVTYHLVDDDNNELSTVSIAVKLRILN